MWRVTTLIAIMSTAVFAQAPTSQPGTDYAITPMRVQTLQGERNYLYIDGQTTLEKIKQWIDTNFNPLSDMADSGKVGATGPAVFVYTSTDDDMTKPFKIETGVPVKPGVAGFDKYKVRPLPDLHAATVIFSGSLTSLPAVYQKLYPDIFAAGLRPTGESRETYLHWEGMDSANNILLIQVGVQ